MTLRPSARSQDGRTSQQPPQCPPPQTMAGGEAGAPLSQRPPPPPEVVHAVHLSRSTRGVSMAPTTPKSSSTRCAASCLGSSPSRARGARSSFEAGRAHAPRILTTKTEHTHHWGALLYVLLFLLRKLLLRLLLLLLLLLQLTTTTTTTTTTATTTATTRATIIAIPGHRPDWCGGAQDRVVTA